MGYNPQESIENTINTVGALLGVHPSLSLETGPFKDPDPTSILWFGIPESLGHEFSKILCEPKTENEQEDSRGSPW